VNKEPEDNKPAAPKAVGSSAVLDDGEHHKYLKVEITRTQGTLVFLKVQKEFNYRACSNLQEIIQLAAEETCGESDWRLGSDQWPDSVEWQAIEEVPKAEAEEYEMFVVESFNDPSSASAPVIC
jgi:hypothetical protein